MKLLVVAVVVVVVIGMLSLEEEAVVRWAVASESESVDIQSASSASLNVLKIVSDDVTKLFSISFDWVPVAVVIDVIGDCVVHIVVVGSAVVVGSSVEVGALVDVEVVHAV